MKHIRQVEVSQDLNLTDNEIYISKFIEKIPCTFLESITSVGGGKDFKYNLWIVVGIPFLYILTVLGLVVMCYKYKTKKSE